MNRLKFLFTVIAIAISFLMASADSGGNHTPILGKTVLLHQKVLSKRPNAPSRFFIECVYGDCLLEFIFPQGVNSLSIKVYNETEEWLTNATLDAPIVEIPSLEGEYTVECTANDGRVFSGIITF